MLFLDHCTCCDTIVCFETTQTFISKNQKELVSNLQSAVFFYLYTRESRKIFLKAFLLSLRLLSRKSRHGDSDHAAATAATTAALANFLKASYFRRWKTWMLHTLYMDASCYDVSVSHMSNDLDFIFMVQWLLEKKFRCFIMLNSLLL